MAEKKGLKAGALKFEVTESPYEGEYIRLILTHLDKIVRRYDIRGAVLNVNQRGDIWMATGGWAEGFAAEKPEDMEISITRMFGNLVHITIKLGRDTELHGTISTTSEFWDFLNFVLEFLRKLSEDRPWYKMQREIVIAMLWPYYYEDVREIKKQLVNR
jgi:hypothetical protein